MATARLAFPQLASSPYSGVLIPPGVLQCPARDPRSLRIRLGAFVEGAARCQGGQDADGCPLAACVG